MAYSKAGCENPGKSSTSEVISNRQTRPGVQLPGDRTRKIPGPSKAGQDTAGEANQVKITHGSKSPGKQTWKGAANGYTTRSIPDHKASPAKDTMQDTRPHEVGSKPTSTGKYSGQNVHLNGSIKKGGGSAKQSVKGKNPAKSHVQNGNVAGQS